MKRWLCDYIKCSNRTHYCWQSNDELNKHYKLFNDMIIEWNQAIEKDETIVEHSSQSLKIKLYIMYETQDDSKEKSKKTASTEEVLSASISATMTSAAMTSAAMTLLSWSVSSWSSMLAIFSSYQMSTSTWNMSEFQTIMQYYQQSSSSSSVQQQQLSSLLSSDQQQQSMMQQQSSQRSLITKLISCSFTMNKFRQTTSQSLSSLVQMQDDDDKILLKYMIWQINQNKDQ